MATNCVLLGKVHLWQRKPEWFSAHSTQIVGFKWVCDRCGKESDEDPRG